MAASAWSRLSDFSLRCYLGSAPGMPSPIPASGLRAGLERRAPSPMETEPGFARVAVIQTRIRQLDWLYLSARGHRRALFSWDDAGACHSEWLTP